MSKFAFTDLITEVENLLRAAAATYSEVPAVFSTVDKRVLRKALRLADGNVHRMTVEPDGSVIVWNRAVW